MGIFETLVEDAWQGGAGGELQETPYGLGFVTQPLMESVAIPTGRMSGRGYLSSKTGWYLVDVPNDLVKGIFASLDEEDAVLPINKQFGQKTLNAHISVLTKEDVQRAGGPSEIREYENRKFRFQLGPIKMVNTVQSKEWKRAWYVTVESPELEEFRSGLGLSPRPNNNKFDFHITVAGVRR